jgi:hypothetical protein
MPCDGQPAANLQATTKRITDGAPDFETVADGPDLAPDNDGNKGKDKDGGPLYQPIRSAPGWAAFKKNFYYQASARICVPAGADTFRLAGKVQGRVDVAVEGTSLLGPAVRDRAPPPQGGYGACHRARRIRGPSSAQQCSAALSAAALELTSRPLADAPVSSVCVAHSIVQKIAAPSMRCRNRGGHACRRARALRRAPASQRRSSTRPASASPSSCATCTAAPAACTWSSGTSWARCRKGRRCTRQPTHGTRSRRGTSAPRLASCPPCAPAP